jgi:outer membrane receptor protein involved in Fe transport
LRVDKNQNLPWIQTPAASLVYKTLNNTYIRASFSSALRNPTLSDQYLNLNVGRAILAGNINGVDSLITIPSWNIWRRSRDFDDLIFFDLDPVKPEKVQTWEAGLRTTLFNALFVDMGLYYNTYNDFLGYEIGFSIGLNYYLGGGFAMSGNYSFNKLTKVDKDDSIIPAYNTPENKFNLGFSGRDMNLKLGDLDFKNFGFNVNYKWVEGFSFEGSPQFTGLIPSYDLLDVQINYTIPTLHTTLKVGASNVLNNEHFETYGGPFIGRLGYISLLYDFKKK